MANFKSDAQGFLIGEKLLDFTQQMVSAQARAMPMWREIRSDVRSIARQLGVQVPQGRGSSARREVPTSQATPAAARTVRPVGRSAAASAATSQRAQVSPMAQRERALGRSAAIPQRSPSARFLPRAGAAVAEGATRDQRGRFVAGNRGGGDVGGGNPNNTAAISLGLSEVADRLGQVSANFGGQTEGLDPTLNAAKEVKDTMAPIGRGLGGLFGRSAERKREQAKERWYKKMWLQLTSPAFGRRREATAGGGGGAMSWLMGMAGGLAAKLPALIGMVLSRVFLPVAALWGSFKLGQWIGEKINAWLVSSGMQAKLFDAVDWIKETAAGAWGTVTQKAGDAWARVTDTFAEGVKGLMALPDKIGQLFSNLDQALRKIPVIGAAYGKAADAVKKTAAEVKQGYDEKRAGSTAPAATVAQAVGSAVAKAHDWMLGQTSRLFESGKAGAAAVSSGKGDNGGASYGTYQLSSKTGTLAKFLGSTRYGEQFAGLQPGSPEFAAKWREVAKSDPSFGAAQHDFIKASHYAPALAGLKNAGLDLSGRGAAVQDALWSTSVQFGAGSARRGTGAIGLFMKALNGKDLSQLSDAQIVSATQDYKAVHNDRLFAKSDAATRAGTLARAVSEKAALLRLDGRANIGAPALPRSASAGVPTLSAADLPKPVEIKDMPTRLNTDRDSAASRVTVTIPERLGQDVGDRGLAHIVSGGLGA